MFTALADISREQAAQIAGSEEELDRISPRGAEEITLMNGAMLHVDQDWSQGGTLRYRIMGFRADESDVTDILEELEAGETCFLWTHEQHGKIARMTLVPSSPDPRCSTGEEEPTITPEEDERDKVEEENYLWSLDPMTMSSYPRRTGSSYPHPP